MPEYISREAVLAQKGDCYDKDGHLLYAVGTGNILRIPAADVVEVVRCRDCENWDTDWVPNHAEEGQYFCPILGQVTDTDFYCGCGKRKDGGQDETQTGPYDLLYEEGGYNSNGV